MPAPRRTSIRVQLPCMLSRASTARWRLLFLWCKYLSRTGSLNHCIQTVHQPLSQQLHPIIVSTIASTMAPTTVSTIVPNHYPQTLYPNIVSTIVSNHGVNYCTQPLYQPLYPTFHPTNASSHCINQGNSQTIQYVWIICLCSIHSCATEVEINYLTLMTWHYSN